MAEEDSSQEKTEEPTERKLQKAREDGQLARSKELATSVVLIVSALSLILFGHFLVKAIYQIAIYNFSFERDAAFDYRYLFAHLSDSLQEGFTSLIPIFILLLVAAIVGPISLSGWNFSSKAIAPKFDRMDPLKGVKRMVSKEALMELLKGWAKVLVVATASVLAFAYHVEDIQALVHESIENGMLHLMHILLWAFFIICCSSLAIAAIDVPFQVTSHTQKMRMTMQEVKDEFKNTEGKPEVKSKLRQLQREASQRQMMGNIPDADVVITNPDHFAVALKYKPNEMPAPLLVAKGADEVAEKIKEIAREYNIPVICIPPLARSIFHFTKIDEEIPEGLYLAVAQVLAYVYQVNQWKKGFGQKPQGQPDYPIPDDLRWDNVE